jgi:hypothetical protein
VSSVPYDVAFLCLYDCAGFSRICPNGGYLTLKIRRDQRPTLTMTHCL